jgi:hypothetical protein
MGYRSEVAYTINFRDKHLRDAYVALVLAKDDKHLSDALAECYVPKNEPRICFHTDHYKWYHDYPEVQAHTTLYKWARVLYGDDCDYRIVRIGEESNDVEEAYTGGDLDDFEDCYVNAMIETSFPKDYREENEE